MKKLSDTTIEIRQEWILPLPFRIVGLVLTALGVFIFIQHLFILTMIHEFSWGLVTGIGLAALGILIGFSHYRLRIDAKEKWYRIYVWVLGFKNGKQEKYTKIERIFINQVLESRNVSSFTGHKSEVQQYLFKAFIKLENGEKIHLDTDKEEKKLKARVEEYRQILAPEYHD